MKKVAVIGHFAFGKEYLDGQTVKTKTLTDALCKQLTKEEVIRIDTHGGRKTLFKAPLHVFKALQNSNVVIFPAHNGLRVYGPLLALCKGLFKNRKLHYMVIGGWLPQFLQKRKYLAKALHRFDGIYVETNTMRKALEEVGFSNVVLMPNCKDLQVLLPEQMPQTTKPYKLCTFSRVMKEKGMEDAIEAVRCVNEAYGETVYTLDFYGPVDDAQTQWFDRLKETFPDYVRYCGAVPAHESVEVIKDYFALLFPTRFYTEGIPGTIIDAYAAGVPVIGAKWESFADVVDDGKTGWGYEFGNIEAFTRLLEETAENPERITGLKTNCLKKAQEYLPEGTVQILLRRMEG